MYDEGIRERTLIELFGALEGKYGPNYECKYYPCHFNGQDCSFCFCPFYPCFIYDLGYLKSTTKGYVWSCKDCKWIHEKDSVEEVLSALSTYSRQKLIEEDWLFFNRIIQRIYYGREVGEFVEGGYSLMGCLENYTCEEIEKCNFLKVTLNNFEIINVIECQNFSSDLPSGLPSDLYDESIQVYIPLLEKGELFGFYKDKYLKCKLPNAQLTDVFSINANRDTDMML